MDQNFSSASASERPAARRQWRRPQLMRLPNPAEAQGGLLIGPEIIILLS